jgi:hypothetical protein
MLRLFAIASFVCPSLAASTTRARWTALTAAWRNAARLRNVNSSSAVNSIDTAFLLMTPSILASADRIYILA